MGGQGSEGRRLLGWGVACIAGSLHEWRWGGEGLRHKKGKRQGEPPPPWRVLEEEEEGRGKKQESPSPNLPHPHQSPFPRSPLPRLQGRKLGGHYRYVWVISTCFIPAIKIIKNISNYYTHTK